MEASKDNLIQHLVISGGVIYGFTFYGCIRHLIQSNMFDMNQIQTIYCTSVGAIIGSILALKDDWSVVDNYFINRPWQDVFHVSLERMMACYQNRGIFGKEFIFNILEPLFRANDLDINTITLSEFKTHTNIDMHIFVVQLPEFELVDLNPINHPDWKLIDAIYASACIPPIFQPFGLEDSSYIDGGFLINYPIQPCITNHSEGKVLGLQLAAGDHGRKLSEPKMNLFEYIFVLLCLIIQKLRIFVSKDIISSTRILEVNIQPSLGLSLDMFKIINSVEERKRFIQYGVECAETFLGAHQVSSDVT